ncbi:Hyccin [Sesbania bispinosa]|nr:Hyccin [Sesbania bispinosa]
MSDDETNTSATASTAVATTAIVTDSPEKIQSAIQSLSSIVPSLISSTINHLSLLQDPDGEIYTQISTLLRQPNSGAGDNNLCRWLYDTFQSGVPELQLLVLRFLPVIAGVYLSRIADRKPQAGFEAVLLALYAHETTSRTGEPVTITIPDMSHPSVYHESKTPIKNNATDLNAVVVSPALEPHGTVRSTRRARIVGVALELFYSKISQIPVAPKIQFCEFCKKSSERVKVEGRVPLPWELLQPILRILAHCLLGPNNKKDMELFEAANEACRCLFARAMHDVDPKAILPMRSLLRLSKSVMGDDFDPTELPVTDVITI